MLGIIVDWGNPNDPPDTRTVCGLGARMLGTLPEILRQNGAEIVVRNLAQLSLV